MGLGSKRGSVVGKVDVWAGGQRPGERKEGGREREREGEEEREREREGGVERERCQKIA